MTQSALVGVLLMLSFYFVRDALAVTPQDLRGEPEPPNQVPNLTMPSLIKAGRPMLSRQIYPISNDQGLGGYRAIARCTIP